MSAALAAIFEFLGDAMRSKKTTASAASAPALVAPNESTSTPHFQVASAGEQSRLAMALAKRAPSMCSFMPRAWTSLLIAASSEQE